ncbi:MAG: hypothetical protein HQK78_01700 [Desulfobacterales bacterium]|nr:hypothetical protein [Desulfobacterales bacterium]
MKKQSLLIILLLGMLSIYVMQESAFAGHADFYSNPLKYKVGDSVTFVNNSDSGWGDYTDWYVDGVHKVDASGKLNYTWTATAGDHTIKLVAWDYIWPIWFSSDKTITVHVYNNSYPIVLVHGFLGWGREEISLHTDQGDVGLYYWGGTDSGDLEKEMNNRGFKVWTASVGPITSAWDRACELYAQLMGTTTPFYGASHSNMHTANSYTHAQTGNSRTNSCCYNTDGRLKNTKGNVIPKLIDGSTKNPIHLVSHSFGGQTVRILADLLEDGSPNCSGNPGYKTCEESSDPNVSTTQELLFKGGNTGVIRSITTIATPNNGTNLAWVVVNFVSKVDSSLGTDIFQLLTSKTVSNGVAGVYDLDVDQWTGPGDTSYANGLRDQDIIIKRNCGSGGNELCGYNECSAGKPVVWDLSPWDLSPCGAAEINTWATAKSDIFYFSISTEQVFKYTGLGGHNGDWYCESPIRTANPVYWWPAYNNIGSNFFLSLNPVLFFEGGDDAMGFAKYTTDEGLTDNGLPNTNNSPTGGTWKEHDGVVNTISMAKASCDQFTTNANGEAGKWKSLGIYHEDHFDITGGFLGFTGEESLTQDDGSGGNGGEISFYDMYDGLFNRLWNLPAF